MTKGYRTLLRYKLNRLNRKRLRNHDFSIISSNCVGGVISHELGEKFNSPTVNLYILPEDYIKFLKNLKFYINQANLIEDFIQSKEKGYPVGMLADIRLYFVHYLTFYQAEQKWYERCKRINWSNLYIMMVERDSCTADNISEFDILPYNHKIIFTTSRRLDIKSSYYIPGTVDNNDEVIDLCLYKGKFTGKRWIDDFDYIDFLNDR